MTGPRLIGACVLLLTIPATGLAQSPAASFKELIADGSIHPGDTVYVTDAWGHRFKTRLGELQPGRLVVTQGSLHIPMPEAEVGRIQRADSLQNGLWLGLAAGIAAAWATPSLFCDLPDDECAAIVVAAIGLPSIAAGTVTGVLVDAAVKKTVFRSRQMRWSRRIQVSPMLGRRQAGALATIQF